APAGRASAGGARISVGGRRQRLLRLYSLRCPAPSRSDQRLELRRLHRPAEMVPLRVRAMHLPQLLQLLLGLYTFRDHFHVEALRQREDGVDDLHGVVARADAVDEAPVDLQGVDGKLVQVAERAVTGAEIVEVDAN